MHPVITSFRERHPVRFPSNKWYACALSQFYCSPIRGKGSETSCSRVSVVVKQWEVIERCKLYEFNYRHRGPTFDGFSFRREMYVSSPRIGRRSLKPYVTKACNTNIAYILATVQPMCLTLVLLCKGKKPLLDHGSVACTGCAIVAPCKAQLELNLAPRTAFREA